jgi:hypothetical protein
MSNLIQVEFHKENITKLRETDDSDFLGSYIIDFPSSTISFSGDYLIIEDDNQVGKPFHLGTVKTYKIVSK